MLNWLKANRKAMNAGKLKEERIEAFKQLMAKMEEYKRKNQYE
jgi:putative ribosome biogenesis GTPase RsgA